MSIKLEVVRAGAGSGKTTDLCETVALAVASGLDPSRILATTFTKKAAAELKGRVQAKLLSIASAEAAERLDLAFIGTVHSVAHRLVSKFAIELGLSPRLEVLESGTDRVLGEILSSIPADRWKKLTEVARKLSVDKLPDLILALIACKRGNRIGDSQFADNMTKSGLRMCQLLAPRGPREIHDSRARFRELLKETLEDIASIETDRTKKTLKVVSDLGLLLRSNEHDWNSFIKVTKLETSKTTDPRLNSLREFASNVPLFSELHSDIHEFQQLLASETIALDRQFELYKRERGLVDFTDLETLLLTLLENDKLAESVAEEFDLILVDEFQDTNPLQLAIFSRLQEIAPRSRWVGDSRQAIYGFRDTDPRLVESVWNQIPSTHRFTLSDNYRSQHGLVKFVGELFGDCFTEEDPRQNPRREKSSRNIERWILQSSKNEEDARCIATGVAELVRSGTRHRDIAVLARTNAQLKNIAEAMDGLKIPYLIENHGLLSTREGALLLAGLRLVGNRYDSLAAATILHLFGSPSTETPEWLEERLGAVLDIEQATETDESVTLPPWAEHELLKPLEQIDFRTSSPRFVVLQVIEALSLPKLVHQWGDSVRRSCNLDSAVRHAQEYEESALLGKGTATLSGLILHMEALAANMQDMRYASPGQNAITLISYHASKGLEWPVVILTGLTEPRAPDLWKPCVRSHDYSGQPLDNRELRNWFWPFGYSQGPFSQRQRFQPLDDSAAGSPEGREENLRDEAESNRLLYVGCTRARDKLIFAHRGTEPKGYAWLAQLPRIDQFLDPTLAPKEYPLTEFDTTFVIRHLYPTSQLDGEDQPMQSQRWFAAPSPNNSSVAKNAFQQQRFHSPSMAEAIPSKSQHSTFSFQRTSQFLSQATDEELGPVGSAVHSYLAAIPSLVNSPESLKHQVAERCKAAFGVSGKIPSEFIVAAGQEFQTWVNAKYPTAIWHTELPISGPRSGGGQWVGSIDLLLELPTGEFVLMDHKCIPLRKSVCEAKAQQYTGQIGAYEEVLRQSGMKIESRWVHFPLPGLLVQI